MLFILAPIRPNPPPDLEFDHIPPRQYRVPEAPLLLHQRHFCGIVSFARESSGSNDLVCCGVDCDTADILGGENGEDDALLKAIYPVFVEFVTVWREEVAQGAMEVCLCGNIGHSSGVGEARSPVDDFGELGRRGIGV